MRLIYCGTSEFAATVLRALAIGPHRPVLVVAPPDRRRGRGRTVSPPPVAIAARELELDLHQTEDVNADGSRRAILEREPEVAAVCAFGQLVKEPLLTDLPMLNVHPSLLPRWRGAAPVERAIMAGDERTGVCVIKLTSGLDSGPVALREELTIEPGDDYGSLAARLAVLGSRLLIDALDLESKGRLTLSAQREEGVTYAAKIESAERRVDIAAAAGAEALRIRALTPHIGAYVELADGARLGLRDAVVDPAGPRAGLFEAAGSGDGLLLGFNPGAVRIGMVQPEGKRWMSAGEYLRGHGLPVAAGVASG